MPGDPTRIDLREIACAVLTFTGVLNPGQPSVMVTQPLIVGDTETALFVEPAKHSQENPVQGPTIDTANRLMSIFHVEILSGQIDASDITADLFGSRNAGQDNVVIDPRIRAADVIEQAQPPSVPIATRLAIQDLNFPHDLFQDPAGAVNIDDTAIVGAEFTSVGSEAGAVLLALTVLFLQGPSPLIQRPPRGAVFSRDGLDY